MPKVNIDLGREWGEKLPMEVKRDEVHYPTLHIDNDEEIDFPHEGEMTVRFKKVSSSMNEREDGSKNYSCTLEIKKIVALYPDKDDRDEPRTGDELDRLAKLLKEARGSGKSSY